MTRKGKKKKKTESMPHACIVKYFLMLYSIVTVKMEILKHKVLSHS